MQMQMILFLFQIEKHWNETVNANCTVNCTYAVTNGSYYGLSYDHGKEIWPLFNGSLFSANNQRDCESRLAKVDFFTVFGVLFAGKKSEQIIHKKSFYIKQLVISKRA